MLKANKPFCSFWFTNSHFPSNAIACSKVNIDKFLGWKQCKCNILDGLKVGIPPVGSLITSSYHKRSILHWNKYRFKAGILTVTFDPSDIFHLHNFRPKNFDKIKIVRKFAIWSSIKVCFLLSCSCSMLSSSSLFHLKFRLEQIVISISIYFCNRLFLFCLIISFRIIYYNTAYIFSSLKSEWIFLIT